MLGAIYGCQVVIYILHRRFEHIGELFLRACSLLDSTRLGANGAVASGWMILYILAIPIFSFVLPVVSFWQMDDFSWCVAVWCVALTPSAEADTRAGRRGSTREIVGEKGKRLVVHDEGKFDPASIPLKSWHDFENELWEQVSSLCRRSSARVPFADVLSHS